MPREPIFTLPPVFRGDESDVLLMAGEANWGMSAFGVEHLRSITNGDGIKVGVVDTGVDVRHPLLGNILATKNFTTSPGNGDRDPNGHGTHCSGTVGATDPRIGVATGCSLYHGKGLGDSGSGGAGLIAAQEWCLSQGCEILSESWGGGGPWQEQERLAREAAEAGIWLVFAAGNSGAGTPEIDYPGRYEHVISVAALNSNMTPASFTSAGDKIDTSGPGSQIWSCRPGGGFVQMSGTSMATPFVVGVLALYRAALKALKRPIPNVYELRKILFSRSVDTHTPGDDRRTGPGWVSPLLLHLSTTPPPPPLES